MNDGMTVRFGQVFGYIALPTAEVADPSCFHLLFSEIVERGPTEVTFAITRTDWVHAVR